jgi:hypothetical protein
MRKGLVQRAMEKGEIALGEREGTHSIHNMSYEDIRKERIHVLCNLGIDILNTSVSVFIRRKDEGWDKSEVLIYWGNLHEPRLTREYKDELSATQVLREIYQKVRGW